MEGSNEYNRNGFRRLKMKIRLNFLKYDLSFYQPASENKPTASRIAQKATLRSQILFDVYQKLACFVSRFVE